MSCLDAEKSEISAGLTGSFNLPVITEYSSAEDTKPAQRKMLNTRSQSSKAANKSAEFSIAETPVLLKFLLNPNSYVSYINPQLLSDGSNINQWIDSLNDLAHLLFELINLMIHLNNNLSAAHFNKLFMIFSEFSSLDISIPPVAQGLFIQALTSCRDDACWNYTAMSTP
ncbi:hypothetical protein VP01_5467g1, partial [Puccinia sorghi]